MAEGEPLSLVPIAVARWTREVLREATGVAVELKWPNDLYCGRRKLAGDHRGVAHAGRRRRTSRSGSASTSRASAADLGVENATTLEEETGRSLGRAPILQALLDRFDRELAAPRWSEEVREWELASLHRPGDRLTIRRNGEEVTGQYLGLDPSGFLRLRTESGEAIVSSGEVAGW